MGRPRIRFRRPSYAASASLLAIVLATAGSATAAVKVQLYTGAHIKNESLLGIDFKNQSLAKVDFAATTTKILSGKDGAPGDKGAPGTAGTTGPKGPSGDDALSQYSSDFRDNKRLNTSPFSNSGRAPFWELMNVVGDSQSTTIVQLGRAPIATTTQQLQLSSASNSSDPITVLDTSDVIVIANIELWHRGNPLGDDSRHTRAECQALISGPNGTSGFTPIGYPVYVSSDAVNSIRTVTVTAGTRLPAGSYSARITCRSADEYTGSGTGDHKWEFTGGNLVVLAARH